MDTTKILIIEDDLVFLSVLKQFLTQQGYEVITADTGEAGLALFETAQPDIVLCDLMLPQISGLGVLNTLLKTLSQVPVIVISGSTDLSDIREAVKLGASDYFVKPIRELDTLHTSIQNCLSQSELLDEYDQKRWEEERWELEAHFQALYEDDLLFKTLSKELVPHHPLNLLFHSVFYEADTEQDVKKDLVIFQKIPEEGAFVCMATAEPTGHQRLTSLLILKSILNKFLREAIGWAGGLLKSPAELMTALNKEICHLDLHCPFEVVVIWLDAQTETITFSQAGDLIENQGAPSTGNLGLGIWQNANYKAYTLSSHSSHIFKTPHGTLQLQPQAKPYAS